MSAASEGAESFSERVSSSYHQLSLAASHLNLVSDELGKSIAIPGRRPEEAESGYFDLVAARSVEDPVGNYSTRYIGYAKGQ